MEPVDSHEPRHSRRSLLIALVLILITMWPVVRWPGDAKWEIDFPRLIANAWYANDGHYLAAHGLFGNFGVPYSPVPTHIYQVLLAFTHDPFALVVIRALLSAFLTAAALLWLARSMRLPWWITVPILASPNIVAYHRMLWDANFTIPFGAIALAAFADFLRTKRKWPLRLALGFAVQTALIHPQALPLSLPILGYLIAKERPAIRADSRGVLWTAAVLLILNGKYLVIASGAFLYRMIYDPITSYPVPGERWVSILSPLIGGNLLTGYDYGMGLRPGGPEWLVVPMLWCARLIYPLIWTGIVIALWRTFRRKSAQPNERDVSTILGNVGLIGLVLQALIFGILRLPTAPHYFFGTFALHLLFAWLALDALRNWIGRTAIALFGIGCFFITLGGTNAFRRPAEDFPGWPTLQQAVAAVETLNQYGDTAASTDIVEWKTYPQCIRALRLLLPPSDPNRPVSGRLMLTRKKRNGSATGEVTVIELNSMPPPNEVQMEITPLPRDWVPDRATWFKPM